MLLQTCFFLRDFPSLRLECHSSARAHQKPFAVAVCILSQAYFLRFLNVSTREKAASSIPYHLPQNCWLPHRKIKSTRAKNLRNAESSLKPRRRQWQPSGTLAWTIPWMEEPGGLWSMGSLRVGHDWATSLSLLTFMHWRRKWQPTPGFSPGEPQGRGSLMGCRLWGRTASDTTEAA